MVVNTLAVDDEVSRHYGVILPLHTKATTSHVPKEMRSSRRARWKANKILFKTGVDLHLRK